MPVLPGISKNIRAEQLCVASLLPEKYGTCNTHAATEARRRVLDFVTSLWQEAELAVDDEDIDSQKGTVKNAVFACV